MAKKKVTEVQIEPSQYERVWFPDMLDKALVLNGVDRKNKEGRAFIRDLIYRTKISSQFLKACIFRDRQAPNMKYAIRIMRELGYEFQLRKIDTGEVIKWTSDINSAKK